MTRHKHAEVMIAYANDTSVEIEYYDTEDDLWLEVDNPSWFEDIVYRIKPKQAEKGDFICEIDGVKWWLGPESDEQMSWSDAKDWVEQQGCVLPPREVLLMCYLNERIRKQFKKGWYWSDGEYERGPADYAWSQGLNLGRQDYCIKTFVYYVRGVISSQ